nr:putative ribonuclease H-like domain-containing protein [Tanacetum cinerariifolium]
MIAILEKTKHNIDLHQIVDFIEASHIRQYTRRATWIAQSKALSLAADEPASLLRDNIQGDAFHTVSSLDAGQGRENIIKTTALPHESSPKVTSLDADEGIMQQKLQELMDLYNSLQRQQTQMVDKIKDQDLEISGLKARVKILKDKERERAAPAQEDAPIKGGSMEIGEEVKVERSTELGSNDTEEIVNVLNAMEAANILTSGVAAVSVSPVAAATTVGVSTVSGLVPNICAIFTTASVVTPYLRRPREIFAKDKGKEKVEELKMVIEGLDRRNKMIAKHLHEYEQAAADLSIGEKIELINELVKYQDHHVKILKYQAQQSKPLSKKEQREFYMSVLKSHAGWKNKHFRGMTLEEIKEKFIPVWKKIEDFVPMSSREKAYTNSDNAEASLDRKFTTGGYQFLGSRLISWQCKKQIVVATSTTEAEYVVAASCCGQVLWIQNQMLDYGFSSRSGNHNLLLALP